eukprot:scaffold237812_cov25-Tisochrysis_lutea.AAC.1
MLPSQPRVCYVLVQLAAHERFCVVRYTHIKDATSSQSRVRANYTFHQPPYPSLNDIALAPSR